MQAFLFTDIESSTRLWEEHPVEMSKALERHDAIMGEAIAASGRVLKTTGDGAVAVFDSTADAIRACSTVSRKGTAKLMLSRRRKRSTHKDGVAGTVYNRPFGKLKDATGFLDYHQLWHSAISSRSSLIGGRTRSA